MQIKNTVLDIPWTFKLFFVCEANRETPNADFHKNDRCFNKKTLKLFYVSIVIIIPWLSLEIHTNFSKIVLDYIALYQHISESYFLLHMLQYR